MCRHLAWLGEPRSLASLISEPEFGLEHQSYAPRRQARGLMNADGWGVGFWADGAPRRWRSTRPLWGDASFASLAPVLSSAAVLAAVRSASVGMPMDESAAAPFSDGTWLLSHNGRVDVTTLPATRDAESVCDSAVLAAHVFDRLSKGSSGAAAQHLGDIVREVAAVDPAAYLNLLLTDGHQILGVTWGDPLSYLPAPDGVAVASEPWDDDPRWADVPDHHLIEVTSSGVTVTIL